MIEPLLASAEERRKVSMDDIDYVRDLGLIAVDKPARIANPIYREVIPRQLTAGTEEMTVQETVWCVAPEGRLDMTKLLAVFQQFFREHSEHWVERFDYKGGRNATAAASLPATDCQRRRADRAGIWLGENAD